MKVKDLDRDATIKMIEMFKKRVEFNNELNSFVRKFMKERHLESFNGYHDMPTDEMISVLQSMLDSQEWMSDKLKLAYRSDCSAIFGQVYGPQVNRYILKDLHDLEKHLDEIEKASQNRDEENEMFRVERDLNHNRLNLFFKEIPCFEARTILKRSGFKWSPYLGAWTRQLNDKAEKSLENLKNILI